MNRPCKLPGCPRLVTSGAFCSQHVHLKPPESKYTRESHLPYRANWRKRRMMFLRRNPLCKTCGAIAREVDHMIPITAGGSQSDENLQALCKTCHNRKTNAERKARNAAG